MMYFARDSLKPSGSVHFRNNLNRLYPAFNSPRGVSARNISSHVGDSAPLPGFAEQSHANGRV